MKMKINKYDIVLVDLEPVKWHEQKWIRPCIILQSNLINNNLWLTIIAPLTSNLIEWPSSLIIENFKEIWLTEKSKILFHQVKVIDEKRIIKKIWNIADIKTKNMINERIKLVFDTEDLF